MNLIVWKSPVVEEHEEARMLVERYFATGSRDVFDPSDDVVRFYDELMARFPPLEAFSEEDLHAGVPGWSDSPERSDHVLVLGIRWSAGDDLLDAIEELARKHELVLYDPQGPEVRPPWADEDAYRPTRGELVQAVVAGTAGALLAVGAWIVSIPVLSWVVIVIGGFLAVMAVYTVVVLAPQAWTLRRSSG